MSSPCEILKKIWGFDEFRNPQKEIINSILKGNDTLAILPTGGGKSICYQIPALIKPGVCLVVSPLIALMHDQVKNLKKKGIKATIINSELSYRETIIELDNCQFGKTKFVFLSPEKLKNKLVSERLKSLNINLIAVDEAHCISQWGYDFRPSYIEISNVRDIVGKQIPVLALTASATKNVAIDIMQKLLFSRENIFKKSVERTNIQYSVVESDLKKSKIFEIVKYLSGSGIIYASTRAKTKEISDFLNKNNIKSDYFHAGLSKEDKQKKYDNWMDSSVRIIVATNAFGMGIDKSDVRFVIHHNLPPSIENYYQEAGRAGRDGEKSHAILIVAKSDKSHINLKKQIDVKTILIKKTIEKLYNNFNIVNGQIDEEFYNLNIFDICKKLKIKLVECYDILDILEKNNFITIGKNHYKLSEIKINYSSNEIINYCTKNTKHKNILINLLRLYPKIIHEKSIVNENIFSKKISVEKNKLINSLEALTKQNILSYDRGINNIQIKFNNPREDNFYIKKIIKNFKILFERKYLRKIEMINYAFSKNCRSNIIMQYFGEKTDKNCGNCDYCRKIKNTKFDKKSNRLIIDKIKNKLEHKSININELKYLFKYDFIDETIKELIENNEITYDYLNNNLSLSKNKKKTKQ